MKKRKDPSSVSGLPYSVKIRGNATLLTEDWAKSDIASKVQRAKIREANEKEMLEAKARGDVFHCTPLGDLVPLCGSPITTGMWKTEKQNEVSCKDCAEMIDWAILSKLYYVDEQGNTRRVKDKLTRLTKSKRG